MDVAKLKKMAKFLDGLKLNRKTERFDLDRWTCQKFNIERMAPCGTAACAIGWAAKKKLFKELTLSGAGPELYPVYDNFYMSWDAVQRLFDISFSDAQYLFSAEDYEQSRVTRRMVAARIRKFIREEGRS